MVEVRIGALPAEFCLREICASVDGEEFLGVDGAATLKMGVIPGGHDLGVGLRVDIGLAADLRVQVRPVLREHVPVDMLARLVQIVALNVVSLIVLQIISQYTLIVLLKVLVVFSSRIAHRFSPLSFSLIVGSLSIFSHSVFVNSYFVM